MSARRQQLLDQAERLLEREGLEQFGVNALARDAKIKPPSLYKHFAGADDLEHALIARFFRRAAEAFDLAEAGAPQSQRLTAFMAAYRDVAGRAPQLYRLATERPLDRELLARIDDGCEYAATAALLRFFDETDDDHTRARVAWAAAHGMVSLEHAGRFPPGADLDAAWRGLEALFVRDAD